MTNGLVDALIARSERRSWLSSVLSVLAPDGPEPVRRPHILDRSESMRDAWDVVQAVRSEQRPRAPDLLGAIVDGEIELRGDRNGADDRAIRAAIARIKGRRTIVIAFDRRLAPGPHGFRKAVRALQLAAQLGIPVVTLIDTSGADPSPESEAGGIAWAIAEALAAMLRLPVPVVCVVTGEGGSGGALALAAGDVLLAYESAVFSVIDPEAAAEILWRSGTRAAEAARLLKLGAGDLLRFGIADGVIPDPVTPENLKEAVAYHLELLARDGRSGAERGRDRRNKWRQSR